MANLDDIFTSNLDENKKKSKMLLGKLLLNMRRNNHIRLYSLMSEVLDTDCVDKKLIIILGDKTSYEMMNNKNDLDVIEKELKAIDSEYSLELKCEEVKKFDPYKFKEFLKQEFGKILTIK